MTTRTAPPRRTQQQRKADTRARLVSAAADLFARYGIDAVSIDAVAEAAGRTSGAVYAHFGSKQALLMAVLEDWTQSLVHLVEAEFVQSVDVMDHLRAVAAKVIVHPNDQTRSMLLLERELWLRAARDQDIAAAMTQRASEACELLTRGFARWIEAGMLDTGHDAATLAIAFRALVVGLEMQQRVERSLDVDGATAAMAALLGIARASHESSRRTDRPRAAAPI